jgi:protein kinase-like protein/3-keto-disaccharide hydrolase/uncharacterized protein DUF1579/putative zinc finger protein
MNEPPNCPAPELLKQLLDGELPAEEQALLTAHLDQCPACQDTVENLAAGKHSWAAAAECLAKEGVAAEPALAEVLEAARFDAARTATLVDASAKEISLDFLDPSDQPDSLGRLDSYEITAVIGRGGNGVVLKAFDEALHRVVAIKVLAPQLATSAAARKRFEREGKAIAGVSYDHVVGVHAVAKTKGLPYLVMQYVAGQSLQDKLSQSGPLELKEILRIGHQTACGLAAAHAQGLVHRDIKPANILLENGVERVKITDFGLARAVDDASLTQTGVVAGTPQYMAPEQASGGAVDHRADLFSLGSVMYAMCTGHPPFRATTTMAVLKRVCEDTPRPIREINSEMPQWLCDIIAKLHAKRPEERFQTAKEVAELLEQCLAHVQQPGSTPLPAALPPGRVVPQVTAVPIDPHSWSGLKIAARILCVMGFVWLLAVPIAAIGWPGTFPLVQVLLFLGIPGIGILFFAVLLWTIARASSPRPPAPVAEPPGQQPLFADTVVANGLRQVKTPAIGLIVAGILYWATIPISVWIRFQEGISAPDRDYLWWAFGVLPAIAGFVFLFGGWKMKRCEYYGLSVATACLPLLLLAEKLVALHQDRFAVTPGDWIGPPFGMWALIVLTRREVREAFARLRQPLAAQAGPRRSKNRPLAFVGTLLAIGVFAFVILWLYPKAIRMFYHELVLEPEEPGVVVQVWPTEDQVETPNTFSYRVKYDSTRGGAEPVVTTVLHGRKRFRLEPGNYWVLGNKDGKQVLRKLVTVAWGGQTTLKIGKPTSPPHVVAIAEDEWKPLFNGKDLAGWKTHPNQPGNWRVENGVLVGDGAPGALISERGDMSPVPGRFELMVNKGGEAGIYYGVPKAELEAKGESPTKHGIILVGVGDGVSATGNEVRAHVVPGHWYTFVMTGNGWCEWLDAEGSKSGVGVERPPAGHMVVRTLKPGTIVSIRKIEIKELPATATPVPKTAADVLPFLAGTWKVEWQEADLRATGHYVCEFAADGRVLRGRGWPEDEQFESLYLFSLDANTNSLRRWAAHSHGETVGPGTGTFNADSRTLLWMQRLPSGNHSTHEFTFVDANTMKGLLFHQDASNKIVREMRATFTRVNGPVALPRLAADPKRPAEMKVLDRFLGEWRNEMTVIDAAAPDKPKTETARVKAEPILGGRFVEMTETNDATGRSDYSLVWFDPSVKRYRQWFFSAAGVVSEFTGTWDEAAKTMATHSPDDGRLEGRTVFKTDDLFEFRRVAKSTDCKVLIEVNGVSRRTASGWVPLFNGKDLSGWPVQPAGWTVENGVLVGTGAGSHLLSQRRDYANFHLRAQVKFNNACGASVLFRYADLPGEVGVQGYETYIGTQPGRETGTLNRHGAGSTRVLHHVKKPVVQPDTWFTLELIADRDILQVLVNGEYVTDVLDTTHASGQLGLQISEQTRVEFRKIEIKELQRINTPAALTELQRIVTVQEKSLQDVRKQFETGRVHAGDLKTAEIELTEAQLKLREAERKRDDLIHLLENLVAQHEELVRFTQERSKAGVIPSTEILAAEKRLAEAKLRLLAAGGKPRREVRIRTFDPAKDKLITKDVPGWRITQEDGGWRINTQAADVATDKRLVRLFEVPVSAAKDDELILRAQLKTEKLSGWADLQLRLSDKKSQGLTQTVTGSTSWSQYEVKSKLTADAPSNTVGVDLSLLGSGTVWIKDIELLKVPPKPSND